MVERLIDANALCRYLADVELANRGWNDKLADTVAEFIEIVDERPTVDAVEVVRCKDCRYFYGAGLCIMHPEI